MDRVERVTGASPEVTRLQERVQGALDRKRHPFDDGKALKFEFDADAGKIQIRRIHGLNRKPTGFIITDMESSNLLDAALVVRTFSSKHEIELQLITQNGTGKYTVRVWVY